MADYTDLTAVKLRLNDANLDSSYDDHLTALLTSASRLIDKYTKRHADAYKIPGDTTRYFDGSGTSELLIGEIAAAPTTVAVAESGQVDNSSGSGGDYTTWASTDFYMEPYNAVGLGIPFDTLVVDALYGTKSHWYKFRKGVKITAKFGYSETVPPEIEEATIIQVIYWFQRGKQGFNQNAASTRFGQMNYKGLDVDVERMIEHFIRGVV